jgi:hypothetical protein
MRILRQNLYFDNPALTPSKSILLYYSVHHFSIDPMSNFKAYTSKDPQNSTANATNNSGNKDILLSAYQDI